jgi:FkbH-like protein
MKLHEALKIVHTAPPEGAESLSVHLVCGFTPLHLATFLAAHLRERLPGRAIEVRTGVYGDLAGNLARLRESPFAAAAVVIEWADLDPRLGLRGLGGWGPKLLEDIRSNLEASTRRILRTLEELAGAGPIALCLPTLPLPPISYLPSAQLGVDELLWRRVLQEFALAAAGLRNVKLVNGQHLDEVSPTPERLDVKSELTTGFPYRVGHASQLAALLAELIQPRAPKKGLITDLDDTLWRGILGEEGVKGVSWDLDRRSHVHALYQQLLGALAESGVLVGVASKNDPALVQEALQREDLLVLKGQLFPVEANWRQKSRSIERILAAWNIGADAVVFVDDSPLELAEVNALYPEMECLLFPKSDDQAVYELLRKLRDLFGKPAILEEDAIRAESIRRAGAFRTGAEGESGQSLEAFLEQVDAEVTFAPIDAEGQARAFELINKTNQFNLNGRRLSEADFQAALRRPGAVSLLISYRDKYGPLGKISALLGQVEGSVLTIDTWVLSCRAFSRHIEHRCLEHLFEQWGVSEIELDYQPTPRNGPVGEFLAGFLGGEAGPPYRIRHQLFMDRKPALFHNLRKAEYV